LIGFANGGKVKWAEDGKPIIEKSDKPVKGCNKSKLDELVKDSNTTKCK
jgi:hypothetical protein